jgi:hypothetical protein
MAGKNRRNYSDANPNYVNPLGLTTTPYTSPVGLFNGTNVSPNGNIAAVNSPSPAGCYDMSGQVYEWVHDWYGPYSSEPQANPTGPPIGAGGRAFRGGACDDTMRHCRTAFQVTFPLVPTFRTPPATRSQPPTAPTPWASNSPWPAGQSFSPWRWPPAPLSGGE